MFENYAYSRSEVDAIFDSIIWPQVPSSMTLELLYIRIINFFITAASECHSFYTALYCYLVAVPGIYLDMVNGVLGNLGIGSMSHRSFACQADGKQNLQCRTLNIG